MIEVTCAIIRNNENEVLVVQKGEKTDHPYKWEFPGGKIKNDETGEECVLREIREELSLDIEILSRMEDIEFDYGIKKIRLIPFVCDTTENIPLLSEHIAYKWMDAYNLMKVDFMEADVILAANYLQALKHPER